jgi:hypothetical protein
MTPAEFYHQRAAECSVLAHQISDSNERAIMQELARCWVRLLARTNVHGFRVGGVDRSAQNPFR